MVYYHYAELVHRQAEKYGSHTALKHRDDTTGKWLKVSWRSFSEKVMLTAEAMAEFGTEVQENIGVYSQNMPQCLYTDFGAYANRAVPIPLYATSAPAQVEYIVKDAGIRTLFVGEQLQYNNAYIAQKSCPTLQRIIIFDPQVKLNPEDKTSVFFDDFLRLGDNALAESKVKVRINEAKKDDLATIIYTSGTTGEPKGVMLHHYNFLEAMRIHDVRLLHVDEKDTSMSFLPLTHIFEKAWSCYCIHRGVKIAINKDPKEIQKTIKEIRPTLMCNVPRFWEKVYAGVQDKINSSSPFMQSILKDAIETGRRYTFDYQRKNLKAPIGLSLKYKFYNNTIFNTLKTAIGIDKGRLFPAAGAPLSDDVNRFLRAVNIPITYGYGLSETTATVSFFPEKNYEFGSIGIPMPDIEIRIGENSEIQLKGKTVTAGYYNKPEENEKSFIDGWFRTGDAGRFENGILYFTERIKDLYKTSNGKYIAPQAIELTLSGDKYIEQVAVIGDDRKFVSALIVPNYPVIEAYAAKNGIDFSSREILITNTEVIKLIESRIEELQKHLASFEKIKRFTILPQPFTMESKELTDTLKLRRKVIAEHYKEQIEAMYSF
jgi:long-chain acyl-CoA synthetase